MIFNGEILETVPLKSGTIQWLLCVIGSVLGIALGQEKSIKMAERQYDPFFLFLEQTWNIVNC